MTFYLLRLVDPRDRQRQLEVVERLRVQRHGVLAARLDRVAGELVEPAVAPLELLDRRREVRDRARGKSRAKAGDRP